MTISISFDAHELDEFASVCQMTADVLPVVVEEDIGDLLGPQIVGHMREAVEPNRYTGELSDSIQSQYDAGKMEVIVQPTAVRGDPPRRPAGHSLEFGSGPRPRLAFGPIQVWAQAKGVPNPGAVWKKIRTEGTYPYPFLDRTLEASEADIAAAANRIGEQLAITLMT